MTHWVLVLILTTSSPPERLEQDAYETKTACQIALNEAARTNYTDGFYRCEFKEGHYDQR